MPLKQVFLGTHAGPGFKLLCNTFIKVYFLYTYYNLAINIGFVYKCFVISGASKTLYN